LATQKSLYDFSFIIATRNDNHGGNMLLKNQFFVNRWAFNIKKLDINCELIIVDWNSPKKLRNKLVVPKLNKNQIIRIIEVPNKIHKKFKNYKKLNIFQMIAKNVGARRATGKYLILTNMDIIFSNNLLKFLKNNELDENCIYRVDRYDINFNKFSNYKINEKTLDDNITHINKKYYTHDLVKNVKYWTYNSFFGFIINFLKLFTTKNLLNFFTKSKLKIKINYLKSILNIIKSPKLHTNACGDFQLISKKTFFNLSGYYEYDGYSFHIDSILMWKAYFMGYKFKELKFKIFHINHTGGYVNSNVLFKNLKKKDINYISNNKLINIIKNLKNNKNYLSDAKFGLVDYKLDEFFFKNY
jgi:hypothetical protein